ncbi:MAG: hypothetical protein MUE85_20990 [Microscillaceae bacterium]|jgi:hypothetical protein|nr:hypothetical protein [Microscillaceae bacterium]
MKSIIKITCFIFLFVGAYTLPAQNAKLTKTKVNDWLSLSLPADFTIMAEDVYARKYGAYRQPLAMYTSPNGLADLGINETINRSLRAFNNSDWQEEDMNMLKSLYKSTIMAMHAEVTFVQDKLETINGRKYIVLEFVGTVKDEDKAVSFGSNIKKQYSYLQYTVEAGKVIIFNFTCPANVRNLWQDTAKQIMQSIKFGKAKKK